MRSVRLCCRGKKHVDQEKFSGTVNATYASNPRLPRLREAASALLTARHDSALNTDENPSRPHQMLARESEALEPRGNAVPEIGRDETLSKARICGTRGNLKRRKGVNPYASAELLTPGTC